MAEPALFRRFPRARAGIAHVPLLSGATPVAPLRLPGLPAAVAERLWVKRDERSSPHYGGNKPRKLEFVLGRALARGAGRLVTTGGLGTHHGLATTLLGRDVGLPTSLVLVPQPVTPEVVDNLRACAAHGAALHLGRGVAGAAATTLGVLARAALAGERPALVPTGGSGAVGDLGLVSAALELAEQIAAGETEAPVEVYVALGTGGTAAGLALGLRLAGLRARVVPVLVTDILPPSPQRIARQAAATWRRLHRHVPDLPRVRVAPGDLPVVTGRVGPGYGAPTPESEAAVARAAEAGLALETTYTAKCMAELVARAESGRLPDGPVLFWNTHNAVPVAAPADTPLPAAFAALVAGRG